MSRARRPAGGWPFCVVAFHRVCGLLCDDLTFPPQRFEALCRHWKDNYDVISLDDLHTALITGAAASQPTISITFDDGYADNIEIAAPILKGLEMPATFFVTTGYIETDRRFGWDRSCSPGLRMMTWAQVRQLEDEGFSIAPHTENHVRVSQTTREELTRELLRSRQMLAEHLRRPATDFAYPFGGLDDCREEDRELIRSAGYRSCFSCYGGLVGRGDDLFHLRRVAVSPRFHATASGWERAYGYMLAAHTQIQRAGASLAAR
jgi:peptidoglycan/xylan/chitin deacetylase (PgdA/CDA1 family)